MTHKIAYSVLEHVFIKVIIIKLMDLVHLVINSQFIVKINLVVVVQNYGIFIKRTKMILTFKI